jgi:hypothetical protein
MQLAADWISATWAELLADGALPETSTVLYVVTGEHDLAHVEAAYLPPNAHDVRYHVLEGVGSQLHDDAGLHRFALFQAVADGPLGGFAGMLRHELRHGEQHHEYGLALFELDGHLRHALGVHDGAADARVYRTIPVETDANRAAARFVRAHFADELAAIAADPRFVDYAREYPDAVDVLEATKDAVEANVDLQAEWNGAAVGDDVSAQYAAARDHAARDRAFDQYNPTRGDRPGVVFV